MKKYILLLIVIVFGGCKENGPEVSLWQAKGLPNVNLSSQYLYFSSPNDGYLLGTYDDNSGPRTATILNTRDGGRTWNNVKTIDSIYFSSEPATSNGNYIVFICRADIWYSRKSFLGKFDLSTQKFDTVPVNNIAGVWMNGKNDFFYSAREAGRRAGTIYWSDDNMKIKDSMKVRSYGNEFAIFPENNLEMIYNLSIQHLDSRKLFVIKNGREELIPSPVDWERLVKVNNQKVLLAGYTRTENRAFKSVEFFEASIGKKRLKHLGSFPEYKIVRNLWANDHVYVALIGNQSGFFNDYDLCYSLDKGKTWQIKELEEKSYVNPGYLIDNTLYLIAGGGRMQKVTFK